VLLLIQIKSKMKRQIEIFTAGGWFYKKPNQKLSLTQQFPVKLFRYNFFNTKSALFHRFYNFADDN